MSDLFHKINEVLLPNGLRYYGSDGTIHNTTKVNIEVDRASGEIVSVWFRCALVPFDVTLVDMARADSMVEAYKDKDSIPSLQGIVVKDEER